MFSKNSHVLLCVLKASSGFYLKTVGCPLSCNGLLHESGQSQKAALRWSPVGDDEETHTHTHAHTLSHPDVKSGRKQPFP